MSDEVTWEPPDGSWASSASTRKTMTSTGRRDTTSELAVRSAVHRRGLRYRVDARPLAGLRRHADLVFPTEQVAVFVDGCYWHGCPEHWRVPNSNSSYWQDKIDGNRARDRDTDEHLVDAGWTVVRVWEHEDTERAANRVEDAVRAARGA